MRFGPCLPVLRAMALVTLEVERALGMVNGRCGRVMVFGWVVGWWESLWLRVEVLGFFFFGVEFGCFRNSPKAIRSLAKTTTLLLVERLEEEMK